MNYDRDQLLIVRKDLHDQLGELQRLAFESNPVQFLRALNQLRTTAVQYDLTATSEIASAFGSALRRNMGRGNGSEISSNYLGLLSDAIGIVDLGPAATQAMLASVAIRLQ